MACQSLGLEVVPPWEGDDILLQLVTQDQNLPVFDDMRYLLLYFFLVCHAVNALLESKNIHIGHVYAGLI